MKHINSYIFSRLVNVFAICEKDSSINRGGVLEDVLKDTF